MKARIVVLWLTCGVGLFQSGALAAQSLPGSESSWAWLYTSPLFDKWEARTGKAIVTVHDTGFTAKLFDAGEPTLVLFTLAGTVNGDEVRVRVIRESSDVSPSDYSGRVVTRRFSGFADYTGTQTILLSDQAEHQIGLTRTLRR
jgi:hypothetical protein